MWGPGLAGREQAQNPGSPAGERRAAADVLHLCLLLTESHHPRLENVLHRACSWHCASEHSTFCVLAEAHEAGLDVREAEDVLGAGKKIPEEQEDPAGCWGL